MNDKLKGRITLLVRNPTVLEYSEQAVIIMDPERPAWIKTSSTGKWIFEQLATKSCTAKEIIGKTAEHYSLPHSAVSDSVVNLLENLEEDGFIRFNGSKAGRERSTTDMNQSEESSLLPDDTPSHGLISVWFNILSQCNLSCSHCFQQELAGSRPISVEKAKSVLETLGRNNVKRLYISGGEPLIHPQLLSIVTFAREVSSWQIFLVTNGFTDDLALIEKLTDLVDYFQISVDGIDAETHNAIRGDDSFEKATRVFSIVSGAKSRAKTGLSFTPLPSNIDQIPKLFDFAMELQADAVYLTKPKQPNRYSTNEDGRFDEFLSEDFRRKMFEKYDEMVKCCVKMTKDMSTFKSVKVPVVDSGIDPALSLLLCAKKACCSAGGDVLFIDERGECYPCAALASPEHALGNILDTSFDTIYRERANRDFRQSIHVDNIPECRECPFRNFCAGGCRALRDDITKRTPYCELEKERFHRFLQNVRAPSK